MFRSYSILFNKSLAASYVEKIHKMSWAYSLMTTLCWTPVLISAKSVVPSQNELQLKEWIEDVTQDWPHEIPDFPEDATSTSVARVRRQAVSDDSNLWTGAQIPYTMEDTLPAQAQRAISAAIAHWENRTCVRFRRMESTAVKLADKKYVRFVEGLGCHSSVGRGKGEQPQDISIGAGCQHAEMMIHEIGHLVGLWHEHARPDRDAHVIILWNNIKPKLEHNFDVVHDARLLSPYDLSSMMHYDLKTFALPGKFSLTPIDPRLAFLIGFRMDLSFYDTLAANRLYDCSAGCPVTSPVCENEGFLTQECTCRCPRGTTGNRCQYVTIGTGCGGVVHVTDSEVEFSSPGYPAPYDHELDCTWLFKTELGSKLELIVDDIDIEKSKYGTCRDQLEVRYNHIGIEQGPEFCGKELNETLYSTTNLMMVHFRSNRYNNLEEAYTGFRARVHSVPRQDCDSSPCYNGGQCVERMMTNDYYCRCRKGWIGKNCDMRVADGGLSPWSEWSACAASCGVQSRERLCNDPEPQNGGRPCEGENYESRRCGTKKLCKQSYFCDFNDKKNPLCKMRQESKDEIDWILHKGQTPSAHTGPPHGNSSSDPDDQYVYMEASNAADYDRAVLWLPKFKGRPGPYCLQFHYSLHGGSVATLTVLRRPRPKKPRRPVWQHSGEHGAGWQQANVNVFLLRKMELGFMAVRGEGFDGDIAIDDVSISPGTCTTTVSSDAQTDYAVGCSIGKKRRLPVGSFSYMSKDGCERVFCFCNQDGFVDCPEWKKLDVCAMGTSPPNKQ